MKVMIRATVPAEPEGQIWGMAWTVSNLKLDDADSANIRYRNSATGERGIHPNATREWGFGNNFGPPDITLVMGRTAQIASFPYSFDGSWNNLKSWADRAADEKKLWGIAVYKNSVGTGNVKAYQKDIYVCYADDIDDGGAWYECKLTFNAAKSTLSGVTMQASNEEIDCDATLLSQTSNSWWFFDVVGYGNPVT